jgi:glycine cleavage system H protein
MDPKQLKYVETHEWIEPSGERRKVGISDFAQDQLGDIVYVEFPEGEKEVRAGDEVCIVESTKATGTVYAPVAGRIVAYNKALEDDPGRINSSPFEAGWLFEVQVAAGADESRLMGYDDYQKVTHE